MHLKVTVRQLGPLKNIELEIAIPSLNIFYGSNISGKSLLGLTITSLLQSYSLITRYEELCNIMASRDFIDLASTVLGREPLDIYESVRIENGKIVEEPKMLKDVWPELAPEERVLRYIGIMVLNNNIAPYYGWKNSPLNLDILVEFDGSSIEVKGTLPVAIDNELNPDRLKSFVFNITNARSSITGLSLMDPYNEYWSSSSPSARIVHHILSRSEIFVLVSRRGSKLEVLYTKFENVLEESLRSSGYTLPLRLALDTTGLVVKLGDTTIPKDLFSKGLRTLASILYYVTCTHILSAIGFTTVLYLDEPEASLDTYVTTFLPLILAESMDENIALIISTHREDVVLGIEDIKRRGIEIASELYEFLFSSEDRCFKPKKAEYDKVREKIVSQRLEALSQKILEYRS